MQRFVYFVLACLVAAMAFDATAQSQQQQPSGGQSSSGDAQWIWAPLSPANQNAAGTFYFRKTFNPGNADSAVVQITCDDKFELFVNGRAVGAGDDWRTLKTFDVNRFLSPGRNAIAVKATNAAPGAAGLVARVIVKRAGNTDVAFSTDGSWRVTGQETPGWEQPGFNDSRWARARSLGEFGRTAPWSNQVATNDGSDARRFTIGDKFNVERVLSGEETGSLIAMTFNEFGEILASREGGPLLLVVDKNSDSIPETVTTYCDQIKSCQGILALNGEVFAVGDGPEGTGFYRLSDEDHNRQIDKVVKLFGFERGMGEHGPHAVRLGPDGCLYLILGNHTAAETPPRDTSPHHSYYEGDLIQPRYEDAGGHAVGIKAPGGVVIRTDLDGSYVEIVGGGLRNAYDFAFNRAGEIFTYDSDMEWDEALPWYRPTRINHVTPGAEFGWRSGWAKWPEYYLDSLPTTVDTGRGSPTGVETYDHTMFPPEYHDAVFACDWARGRIMAIHLQPSGGSYAATAETFLEGRPLNVTDVAVGPDGWLYFSTGGRGTEGGIFRVVATAPPRNQPRLSGVMQAVRQPQLHSSWGRQQVAMLQQKMGDDWGEQLPRVATNPNGAPADRVRALDLMQLFGPFPTPDLLVQMSTDRQVEVRAKVAYLMGLHADDATQTALESMLTDGDATVRRVACEAMVRSGAQTPVEPLVALLADEDRHVAFAAMRALESVDDAEWANRVTKSDDVRVFLMGSTALMAVNPGRANVNAVLARGQEMLSGYLSDADFIDLLRVLQLALHRGDVPPAEAAELGRQLAEEYPASEPRMNRELLRLLAYLQQSSILPRLIEELQGNGPAEDKLHAAMMARFIQHGWTTEQKLALIEYYEAAAQLGGGRSYAGYIQNASRDFFQNFSQDERRIVLAQGRRWPSSALSALASLAEQPPADMVMQLIQLDGELAPLNAPDAALLRTGIVAVLGRSGDPAGMAYLREVFEREPRRRQDIAMGLAQQPNGENFGVLLRALPIVEGGAAEEVLSQLARVDRQVDDPEPIRQVILCGLKLKDKGGKQAVELLSKWTGERVAEPNESWDRALAEWQDWYTQHYPDRPPATLPVEPEGSKWSYQQVMDFLATPEGRNGDAARGAAVFDKAQCVKCHRFGNRGEGIGPDLSTVAQRFQRKEIVESVIFPSQVISDQYSSKTIVTSDGRQFSGIVGPGGGGQVVVLQSNGEKVVIRESDIEDTAPNSKSSMPEGLFDTLTLEEIADLFAYLGANK